MTYITYSVAKNILPKILYCLSCVNQHEVVLNKKNSEYKLQLNSIANIVNQPRDDVTHIAVAEALVIYMTKPSISQKATVYKRTMSHKV